MRQIKGFWITVPTRRRRSRYWRWQRLLRWGLVVSLIAVVMSVCWVLPWGWLPLPTTSFMLRNAIDYRHPYQYTWTAGRNLSPYLKLAAIAAEDQRFPTHNGFDWDSIQQAVADAKAGTGVRGASTISQQVAKNLYLWSGRSWIRKALEVWFTTLIELSWSKERILIVYLNIAQFSNQIFGAEAASQQFFAKPANDLLPEEAALLAAVLPGPEIYQVNNPSAIVYDKQDWILWQMDQLGGVDYVRQFDKTVP